MAPRNILRFVPFLIMMSVLFIFIPKVQPFAQEAYPNRPIEAIVPFPPGGPLDLGIRFFADKWADILGQPVVVINKGGASGAIGAKYVTYAKPDGYTLLATSDSPLITARLERKDAGYDLDSFRLLFNFSKIVVFFSVRSDARWKTLPDFIGEAKSNPGKLKYATWGPNSATVLATEMLCKAAGVKLTFIPFKTSPDSLTAVAGGNADMAVTFALSGLGQSGLIRPLAISDEERVPDYPDLPTLKEFGYPIKYTSQYMGLAAPAKTPDKIVSKLIEAHQKVRTKYAKDLKEKLPKIDQYQAMKVDGTAGMEELRDREKLFKEFYTQIGFKFE
jgi:tripartite-type tricarboxylate transporter receptor subunit TctC